MQNKAVDRDEVKTFLDEATRLSQQNPDNQELKTWVQRFSNLLSLAQSSGEGTVNEAAMFYMYIRDNHCPKCANWGEVIGRLKKDGRLIYLKAGETNFLTDQVMGRARCMINFSIRDVEADERGWGVYRGREGEFGKLDDEGNIIMPDRDFNTDCEPRDSFTYKSKGEPDKPTDMGLDWINQVREEARWWKFSDLEQDATDLMEEFYRDSMCKTPPNNCGKGHRQYHKLAERYNLPRGIEYNKGFYATIHGKVEVVSSSGRTVARGAEVTVIDPLDGESWKGNTDKKGHYEIRKVLLHKECMPLQITARYGQEETWDAFYGPMKKPDPSYRYEKNIEIRKADILGQVSVSISSASKGESNPMIKTYGSFMLVGTWKYQPKESSIFEDVYLPDPQKVFYFFFEEAECKSCSEGCPPLDWKLSGYGSFALPEAPAAFPLDRLIVRAHTPVPHYEVGLGTRQLKKVYGEKRIGSLAPDSRIPPPYCTDYGDYFRDISISFRIRGLLGSKGEMQGSESWTSCTYNRESIGFGIGYIQAAMAGRPVGYTPARKKTPCEVQEANIQAQWHFKKIKR